MVLIAAWTCDTIPLISKYRNTVEEFNRDVTWFLQRIIRLTSMPPEVLEGCLVPCHAVGGFVFRNTARVHRVN